MSARVTDLSRLPTPVLQRRCACGGTPGPDGECAACKAKRLQRQAAAAAPQTAPPIVHEVLGSPGRPLEAGVRNRMEARFGHDFSRVRVHSDARAAQSARDVGAAAYTVGSDVVLGEGGRGGAVLTHELAHVVQQSDAAETSGPIPIGAPGDRHEQEADRAAAETASPRKLQRLVKRESVSCRDTGLTNPDLTGDQAVATIQAADAEAHTLALRAQLLLGLTPVLANAGLPVDADFATALQEELGLSVTDPKQRRLIAQQEDRFRRVAELLESGYLHWVCRADKLNLVGCEEGSCEGAYAFSCPANRLVALCQPFWDEPDEQPGTVLHEPFHVLFTMAIHDPSQPRLADASCFEAFARRLAGEKTPWFSCKDKTG